MSTKKRQKDLVPITENALRVREWERENLPIEQSAMALDLFLIISYNTLIEKPLTLKLLFHSTGFSEAGIRKQLRRFVSEQWIKLEGNGKDRRLKYVVAQPKMLIALAAYSKVLKNAYRKSAPPPPQQLINVSRKRQIQSSLT